MNTPRPTQMVQNALLNGHIGHTFTCWSFADQGGMQVAEDKLLWFNQRENNTIFI